MSNRDARPLPAMTPEGLFGLVFDRLAKIEDRLAQLERGSARALPADFRFSVDGDGVVSVTRISTGNTAQVAGPL